MNTKEREIAEEYASSLSDLTFNSKPLINVLTILAEENQAHAAVIVRTIEHHLSKVRADIKLPVLYLIDSIIKNVGVKYTSLFKQNIATLFCAVFDEVEEKIRANMYKLRSTWVNVFPPDTLYQIDVGVNNIDPAWPISKGTSVKQSLKSTVPQQSNSCSASDTLLKKKKELLELHQKRIELEILQTKAKLEKQLEKHNSAPPQENAKNNLPQLKDEVLKLLSVPKLDAEQSKKLKATLAQLTTLKSNESHHSISTTLPSSTTASISSGTTTSTASSSSGSNLSSPKSSSKHSSKESKKSSSKSSSSSSQSSSSHRQSSVPAKPTETIINPFTKQNMCPPISSDSQRISINPVNSDLVTAVAAGRRTGTIRDPRLRRTDTTTPTTSTHSSKRDIKVIINNDVATETSSKRNERERKSSHGEDLFVSENSRKNKSKSPLKSSQNKLKDEKSSSSTTKRSDKDVTGKKHSNSEHSKSTSDKIKESSSSSRKHNEKRRSKSKEKEDNVNIDKQQKSKDKTDKTEVVSKPSESVKYRIPKKTNVEQDSFRIPKKSIVVMEEDSSENDTNEMSVDDIIRLKDKKKTKESDSLKSSHDNRKINYSKIRDEMRQKKKKVLETDESDFSIDDNDDTYDESIIRMNTNMKSKEKNKEIDKNIINNEQIESQPADNALTRIQHLIDLKMKESSITERVSKKLNKQRNKIIEAMVVDEVVEEENRNTITNVNKESKQREEESMDVDKEIDETKPETVQEQPPPKPRITLKNIALLTLPTPPSSQEFEDGIPAQVLEHEIPIPRTGILEDEINEELDNTMNEPDDEMNERSSSPGKFKEVKASSLKRLRQYGRNRDQITPSPPPPPSTRDDNKYNRSNESQQNSLVVSPKGDVDLRPLLKLINEEPPQKKSKTDDPIICFGYTDIDLRQLDTNLRNPDIDLRNTSLPSPPPPPVISKSSEPPPHQSNEENKDANITLNKTEKVKIRVRSFSQLERTDFGEISPSDSSKNYDTDMRHTFVATTPPSSSSHERNVKAILKQAQIDLKHGSITFVDYSNILRRLQTPEISPTPSEKTNPWESVSEDESASSSNLLSGEMPQPPLPPMGLLNMSDFSDNSTTPSTPDNPVITHSISTSAVSSSSQSSIPSTTAQISSLHTHPQQPPHPGSLLPPPHMLPGPLGIPGLIPTPASLGNPSGLIPNPAPAPFGQLAPPPFPTFGIRPDLLPPPGMNALMPSMPNLPFLPPGGPPLNFKSFGGLAQADPIVLASILKDQVKSINIDSIPRPIRFYGEVGIVFLSWDDPREIGFVKGVRKITIDNNETVICQLNAPEKTFTVDGERHRIHLGKPTRELYIDGDFYECCFGGPPLCVEIKGNKHLVQLEGPPPTVTIDTKKRTDLCAGKIDLYIDEKIHVPMFLDSKPHKVDIDGFPYILRFVEALRTLVINGTPFKINFGGSPVTIALHDRNHTFAFSALPTGIKQGYVKISHMEGDRLPTPPPEEPKEIPSWKEPPLSSSSDRKEPVVKHNEDSNPPATSSEGGIPFLGGGEINVNDLFEKLVALGALPATKPAEDDQVLKKIDWHSDNMKERQPAMIHTLYSGIQCGSCGCRFPPDQTTKYSLHLDWHFRLNRKERDLGRSVQSRKFYYSSEEWCAYYEIEDEENKGQSWFDLQEMNVDQVDELVEIPSCAAELNEVEPRCGVCRDRFEQFYNEEKEEWHLRNAIRVEGIVYHPICYQDTMNALEAKQNEESVPDDYVLPHSEEVPIPEDAEEFTRPMPVGIYTLDDDTEEEEADHSVQIIENSNNFLDDINNETNLKLETENVKFETDLESNNIVMDENVSEELTSNEIDGQKLLDLIPTKEEIFNNEEEEHQQQENINVNIVKNEPINTEEETTEINENIEQGEEQEELEDNNQQIEEAPNEMDTEDNDKNEKEEDNKDSDNKVTSSGIRDGFATQIASSIDGNIEMKDKTSSNLMALQQQPSNKIKINITKTILPGNIVSKLANVDNIVDEKSNSPKPSSSLENDNSNDIESDSNKLLDYPKEMKPAIANRKMTKYPPLQKGKELSALCSIM